MFQIGFWELIMVIGIALWVFGPQQLSIIARLGSRWISRGNTAEKTRSNSNHMAKPQTHSK